MFGAVGPDHAVLQAIGLALFERPAREAERIGVDVSVVFPIVTETEFRGALRDHTGGGKERAGAKIGGPRQSASASRSFSAASRGSASP